MRAIDKVLSEKQQPPALGKGTHPEIIEILLLCECRLLYGNADLCKWVEGDFNLWFTETHKDLLEDIKDKNVLGAIEDVFSMIETSEEEQKAQEWKFKYNHYI